MIVPMRELLQRANATSSAVGAFTCYTLDTAIGVLAAAAAEDSPVILLVSERSFAGHSGELLVRALREAAEQAPIPATVQLDHVTDLKLILRALQSGAQAVMADGSRLTSDRNIEFVCAAVELAGSYGADVEAELGRIEGDEDIAAAAAAGALTDPAEAAEFVSTTGACCLAVSIGNAHGRYARPPALDWPRLDALSAAVGSPLSLHGASGLPDRDVARAVAAGIAKVNVNTELRTRIFDVLRERLDDLRPEARLLDLVVEVQNAVRDVASAKLRLYRNGDADAASTLRAKHISEEEPS